jgi:hypothetical protein
MRKDLFCFVLAGLVGLGPACIIVSDDGDDTVGETGNVTTGNTTDRGESSGGATTTDDANTTAADDTAGATTASDDTASAAGCGWGPTGDDMIPEGYVCGGDGEDPDGNFPQACPDIELVEGGDCGEVQGQGCCDAAGNAWFCGDDGTGPALVLIEC